MTAEKPALTVYCRTWCPDCRRALAWLDEHGVEYVEVDVESDENGRQRAAAHNLGALHTPTFELGDEVCVDFRPETLKEMLGLG